MTQLQQQFTHLTQALICLYGEIKTGKTDFALTAPKPLVHLDIDLGYDRVAHRYPDVLRLQSGMPIRDQVENAPSHPIITKRYLLPTKLPGKIMSGMQRSWDELNDDIMATYYSPHIATLVIDTATVLWMIATGAQLERAQERDPTRISLGQIEYGRPNIEMRSALSYARPYGKNLILVHHITDIIEKRATVRGVEEVKTGERWAGFGHTGGVVDIVARTSKPAPKNGGAATAKASPFSELTLTLESCGFALSAEGDVLKNPTWDTLMKHINERRWQEAQSGARQP